MMIFAEKLGEALRLLVAAIFEPQPPTAVNPRTQVPNPKQLPKNQNPKEFSWGGNLRFS
jgi:hypothetical protein